MRLITFLFLLLSSAVGFSTDSFDYNSINFDGPNCWAYVAMEKGFISHYRYVSDEEISYYLKSYCVEVSEVSKVRAGDVFSIYDKDGSIRHSGLFSRLVNGEEKVLEKGSGNKADKVGEGFLMTSEQLKSYDQVKKYYRCAKPKYDKGHPHFLGKSTIEYVEKEIALAIKNKKLPENKYNQFFEILNKYSVTLKDSKAYIIYKHKVKSLLVQLKKFDPNKSNKPVFRKPPKGFFDSKSSQTSK